MRSIRAKIIIFSASLLLAVLLGQVLFSLFLSRPYFINQKKNEIEDLFYGLKEEYSDNKIDIYEKSFEAEETYNINIIIFDQRQELVYASKNIDEKYPEEYIKKYTYDMDLFVESPSASLWVWDEKEEADIYLFGRFEFEDGYRYIVIHSPIEAINASVMMVTRINAFISAGILIIGIMGALLFSKKLSDPIKDIENVARNVANLDFSTRADENLSTLELARLSTSINKMSDNLKKLISDLKQANKKLKNDINYQKKIDKMRREFVANVSHELKTPLSLLLSYSENLKNNIDSIDKDYYCNTIIDETNKMNLMVKELLDLSAIESGLNGMNIEPFSFSRFLSGIIDKMKLFLDKFKVTTDIEDNIILSGDKHYLEQAIKNYITNAISHTDPGGKIIVKLKKSKNEAVFSVFNQGKPIKRQDMENIWESFYTTDKARTRQKERHVGLGLYIVKTIISTHNGRYGVKNHKDGVEFWFTLSL